jgi:hypothetical protein
MLHIQGFHCHRRESALSTRTTSIGQLANLDWISASLFRNRIGKAIARFSLRHSHAFQSRPTSRIVCQSNL